MRKLISSAIVFLFLIVPFGLTAQRYNDGLIDKTIAIIGNEAIFLSQLEAEVQMMQANGYLSDRNTRCMVLENMLVQNLFLTQARLDSLVVKEDNVTMELEQRMAQVVSNLGGEKEAEEYFRRPLHELEKDWRDVLRNQSLIQQKQQEIASKAGSATPTDVVKFYNRIDKDSLPIISTQYKLSQIVLYPDKEKAKLAVKERLLALRERIINGERFATLATLYSEDPGSAGRGGELRKASKSIYWPQFSDAAMSLKNGQVSQIVETPDGFHIIQMIEKDGDMFNARHILIKPTYGSEDRTAAFKKLDSIRTEILKDSIKFDMAARIYSEDPMSAVAGGLMADEMSGSTYFEKDVLKPMDYSIIKDMKVGDVSEPFESTDNEGRNGHTIYKIIKLEEIVPSHVADIEKDFELIQRIANQDLQVKAIDNFVNEKISTTYIKIDDMFKQCDWERSGWIK